MPKKMTQKKRRHPAPVSAGLLAALTIKEGDDDVTGVSMGFDWSNNPDSQRNRIEDAAQEIVDEVLGE